MLQLLQYSDFLPQVLQIFLAFAFLNDELDSDDLPIISLSSLALISEILHHDMRLQLDLP